MKLRVLTLRFDPELGRFDDEPVHRFLADKELIEVRDHFFVHEGLPFVAVVLTYGANGAGGPKAKVATGKSPRQNWREVLDPAEMPLFNTLREWRGKKAKEEGVPPYIICTNLQLAEVVHARPQSLGKLAEIEGFGAAKIKRYGADMLSFLRASKPEGPSARKAATEEGQSS